MHLFIPFFDTPCTDRALREASRIARAGDQVTIMVPVIVPAALPVDVGVVTIWKRVCQAERRVFHAREAAERMLPRGVYLRCMRVQARDRTSAIFAAVANDRADCILFAPPGGIRGALAMRFGTIPAVIRNAPCGVRFVGAAMRPETCAPLAATEDAPPLSALRVIAINPALAPPGAERHMPTAEGRHAL